jgi:membrane-associated phospholipid phosphatase
MTIRAILEKDRTVSERLRITENKGLKHSFTAFLAHSGDSWFWLVGLLVIWIWGDSSWHLRATLLIIGIVVLAFIVMGIKLIVKRRRPAGNWGAIYRNTDPHSFPSGHAARAMMLAVIACGVGPVWFAIVVLIWSPLVSLARVAMGVHYLMDILVGMVIGFFMGFGILLLQPTLSILGTFHIFN